MSQPFADNLMRGARKAETNVLSVAFFPTQPDQQLPEGSAGRTAFPKGCPSASGEAGEQGSDDGRRC